MNSMVLASVPEFASALPAVGDSRFTRASGFGSLGADRILVVLERRHRRDQRVGDGLPGWAYRTRTAESRASYPIEVPRELRLLLVSAIARKEHRSCQTAEMRNAKSGDPTSFCTRLRL